MNKQGSIGISIFVVTLFLLGFYRFVFFAYELPSSETMRMVLSLALTAASLFVILRKEYGPKDKHWAYATVGTILGFWLRGAPKYVRRH